MANVRIDENGLPKGPIADPLAAQDHRLNITAADGAAAPAANNASWATNPGGFARCRVFAYVTFTGGSSPSAVLRPWLRSPSGSTSGKVGKGESVQAFGSDQVAFDVDVDGDDILVLVETINGSPTSTDIDLFISWR